MRVSVWSITRRSRQAIFRTERVIELGRWRSISCKGRFTCRDVRSRRLQLLASPTQQASSLAGHLGISVSDVLVQLVGGVPFICKFGERVAIGLPRLQTPDNVAYGAPTDSPASAAEKSHTKAPATRSFSFWASEHVSTRTPQYGRCTSPSRR